MDLREAWVTLGFDPDDVIGRIRAGATVSERVAIAEREAEAARKVCSKVSAAHHPDRNLGDSGAAVRFRRTQNAMKIISDETDKMRQKAASLDSSREESSRVIIEVSDSYGPKGS